MSFPSGEAVNDGINNLDFFGRDISYSLPTIGDLIARVQQQGRGAYIWKNDLERAYRQLRIDPVDTPLLAIKFNNQVYLDLCPPFGCRSSSAACQRISNALVFLMAKAGHYAGCHANLEEATAAYDYFSTLTTSLGLSLAKHKSVPPTCHIEWLGYELDTNRMTVSIPQKKLNEVLTVCGQWLRKTKAHKKGLQSLAGRLAYVSNCILPGRKFMSRLLNTIRNMGEKNWTTLTTPCILDIKWFYLYAKASNGVALFHINRPVCEIECDSSLSGGGGNSGRYCYTWKYSADHQARFKSIHQLEAVNLVVAVKTLAPRTAAAGDKVIVWTDNISSSFALQTGRTKDPILACCARELWLVAATHNQDIHIAHRRGELIPLADALSRLHHDSAKAALANAMISRRNLQLISPAVTDYAFFNPLL